MVRKKQLIEEEKKSNRQLIVANNKIDSVTNKTYNGYLKEDKN
jgi:hypothetical protein